MTQATYTAVIVGLTGIGGDPLSRICRSTPPCLVPTPPPTTVTRRLIWWRCATSARAALDSFKAEWGDVWPELRYYTDYRQMLADMRPDLVSVATPDHLRTDITIDAAVGTRAILCEEAHRRLPGRRRSYDRRLPSPRRAAFHRAHPPLGTGVPRRPRDDPQRSHRRTAQHRHQHVQPSIHALSQRHAWSISPTSLRNRRRSGSFCPSGRRLRSFHRIQKRRWPRSGHRSGANHGLHLLRQRRAPSTTASKWTCPARSSS
ncbi:MAG: Gfo/Idh/MocA family oxidoreductase [Caldilineaceae bacterium]